MVLPRAGLMIAGLLALAGCATQAPTGRGADGTEPKSRVDRGAVVSARPVQVSDSDALGPLKSAALGAAGAWATSGGSGWITVIGAVAGAGAGLITQQLSGDPDGTEYVVRMEDGRLETLVENSSGGQVPIAEGTPVLVQTSGAQVRIVPDPNAAPVLHWIDPDALPQQPRQE